MDILDYEGLYMASNQGRIKAVEHIDRAGKLRKEKIMRPSKSVDGYYRVVLNKDGKASTKQVNRIVYEAFNGKIPDNMQCNHLNEIKTDNRLENLNLMTSKENNNWGTRKERAGKSLNGVQLNRQDQSKQVAQYDLDGNLVETYPSTMEAERKTGIKRSSIGACCRNKPIVDKNGFKYVPKTAGGFVWKYI